MAGGAGPIFAPQVVYATGGLPHDTAALDVNGDALLDLLVANRANDQLSILMGAGDGTFAPEIRTPTIGDGPVDIVIADFNNDLIDDVATANVLGDSVSILLNTHSGNLTAGVSFGVGTEPMDLVAADFDGDGNNDIAVCNSLSDTVSIALGNGDGTFLVQPPIAVGDEPLGLGVADLNGDSIPDLVVANASSFTINVLLGTGTGNFAVQPALATSSRSPYGVAIADLDNDGDLDVALPSRFDAVVMTFLNNGTGALVAGPESPCGVSPRAIAVAEINNDAVMDLLVTNFNIDSVSLLIGNGDGSYTAPMMFPTGDQPEAVLAADLDANGDPDLVVPNNRGMGTVSVLINLLNPSAQRVFWSGGGNQTFSDPMNWLDQITPASQPSPIAYFDESVADFGQNAAIVFTQDDQLVGMRIASGNVSMNFNSNDLTLEGILGGTEPFVPLVVGFPLDQPNPDPFPPFTPRLRLNNTAILPSTFETPSLAIADALGSVGMIEIDSSGSSMTVRAGDRVTIGGRGDGVLSLDSPMATFEYGSASVTDDEFVIGESGSGSVDVSGGSITAVEPVGEVVIGKAPDSFGEVRLSGVSSSWFNVSDEFVIADEGLANFELTNGAQFFASTTNGIEIARQPGSFAMVMLTGAGTTWVSAGDVVTVGVAGDAELTLGAGTTMDVFALINTSTGTVRGTGTVIGDLINYGRLSSRTITEPGGLGLVSVDGLYSQFDDPSDPRFSGELELGVASIGGQLVAGRLEVSGSANLSGGLILSASGPLIDVASAPSLVSAATINGRFSIAFFPAVAPEGMTGEGRFLRLGYPSPAQAGPGAVLLEVATLSEVIDVDLDSSFDAGGAARFAVAGDFDGDGDADLALAIPDAMDPDGTPGVVTVLTNGTIEGSPTLFVPAATVSYTVGTNPSGLVVGEFDGVAGVDIAVCNEADDSLNVLTNTGAGVFIVNAPIAVGDAPSAIASSDFDGDGMADLVVTNAGDHDATVLINTSTFVGARVLQFMALPDLHTGPAPASVDPLDIDNDKDEDDLVIANAGDGTITIYPNTGGGVFGSPITIDVGVDPRRVLARDLDADGFPEILTANTLGDSVSVLVNNGDSTFAPSVEIPGGDGPASFALVDLDDDADLDLALVTRNTLGERVVSILRNDLDNGQIAFAPSGEFLAGTGPNFVVAEDFDGDGANDLVTVNETTGVRGLVNDDVTFLRSAGAALCAGDCDSSGAVDFNDLVTMLFLFGDELAPAECDADASGGIDFNDLVATLFLFGPCP
ncbi:MAG: FG-GAP-like repeat-containing protein [Phycisphaerales bacterium]